MPENEIIRVLSINREVSLNFDASLRTNPLLYNISLSSKQNNKQSNDIGSKSLTSVFLLPRIPSLASRTKSAPSKVDFPGDWLSGMFCVYNTRLLGAAICSFLHSYSDRSHSTCSTTAYCLPSFSVCFCSGLRRPPGATTNRHGMELKKKKLWTERTETAWSPATGRKRWRTPMI